MAERVRQSHVVATDDTIMPMLSVGKTKSARMWVYVGDEAHAYNIFDFTLNRGRDGPKYFLGITSKFCWPMAMVDMTVWWPAMRSRAPDAGLIHAGNLLMPRRWRPRLHGRPWI